MYAQHAARKRRLIDVQVHSAVVADGVPHDRPLASQFAFAGETLVAHPLVDIGRIGSKAARQVASPSARRPILAKVSAKFFLLGHEKGAEPEKYFPVPSPFGERDRVRVL
jgi:hypothetical protein